MNLDEPVPKSHMAFGSFFVIIQKYLSLVIELIFYYQQQMLLALILEVGTLCLSCLTHI